MIVLDTNVVSEMMKPAPQAAVKAWLNGQAAETLFLPSIGLAEILFGIASLPPGRRKDALAQALDGLMALFSGRVLPFDAEAARRFAELAVSARRNGKPLSTADGYIAAIAASREFMVASRDTAPFAAAGLTVVDPWS
ncbi:MAG: type II toxin-antitoxin system VapC family toxin [Proteobacteria bacterium]|nr:type II toxin-antitoxin system VapC family toxin [Pseudomonadota bacterium]MBK9252413.1 type II toxin-antitoxin system VapC family toxin [Pseudomonadota bacterium]